MSAGAPTLGVVIVPARGGGELVAALDAAAWADERAVIALAGDVPHGDVPAGVARLAGPRDLDRLAADWILVLGEAERVTVDAAGAMRAALATAPDDVVFALPFITALLDMQVGLHDRLPRLAPRRTALVMGAAACVAFEPGGRRVRRLDSPILRSRGATLSDAVELAGAEASTFAALADRRTAHARGIIWQPVRAALRGLTARGRGRRLGLGRWVIAVLEGYRVVAAYAKLWERRRDQVTVAG